MKERLLHLHVKTKYYNQIMSGEKITENRLVNEYWNKRLLDNDYDGIVLYNAYKAGNENKTKMPWRGYIMDTITHEHFGPDPVRVFKIIMTVPR